MVNIFFYLALLNDEDDKCKFEIIYHNYKASMFNIANAILHDEYLAEDAVHQSFIKIINNLHKINDIYSNKTRSYIVIIIRNTAIDIYRSRKRDNIVSFDDLIKEPADENTLPDDFIIQKETAERIKREINKMNSNYSDAMLLRYVHGYSNEEISKMLNTSNANVRYRLHKGKKMLASFLEEEADELSEF